MLTMPLDQAEGRLRDIIDHLSPGEEIVLTRDNMPVARLIGTAVEKPRPMPGRGKGMLTVIAEDDDHLHDFAECMP